MSTQNKKALFILLLSVLFFQAIFLATQANYEAWEKTTYAQHPPDKIMNAIGVKPGMVIGEVGAGRGRLTVHLARRVGKTGKIYANDIDEDSLSYLRERCKREGINNIETILGEVENPLFQKEFLDMVFMIRTYHALEKPVALLKNLIPCMKPGAPVVIIDYGKDKGAPPIVSKLRESLIKEAREAGFELVRIETFLPEDDIYFLQVRACNQ